MQWYSALFCYALVLHINLLTVYSNKHTRIFSTVTHRQVFGVSQWEAIYEAYTIYMYVE
jgi:hypothetical protein